MPGVGLNNFSLYADSLHNSALTSFYTENLHDSSLITNYYEKKTINMLTMIVILFSKLRSRKGLTRNFRLSTVVVATITPLHHKSRVV